MKIKTLIGSLILTLFFLTAIFAYLFLALPEKMASWTGIGPLDHTRLLIGCLIFILVIIIIGWLVEKLFDRAGKMGVKTAFDENKKQSAAKLAPLILKELWRRS